MEPLHDLNGTPLRADRRWRVTRSALHIEPGLDFSDWVRVGRQVAVIADSAAWWIGDWLNFGRRSYGQRYKQAIAETGLEYQTLRNYAWVASRVAVSRRWDTLSFGHCAELSVEEQDAWLDRCVVEGWTRSELRRRLRLERQRQRQRQRERLELLPIALTVAAERHQRWAAAAAFAGKPLGEWIEDVVDQAAASALDDDHTVAAGQRPLVAA